MKALLERFLGYLALMAALWILFFVLVALARLVERPLHEDRYKVSVPDSAVAQVATVHAQPPITQFGPQTTILCGPLRFPQVSPAHGARRDSATAMAYVKRFGAFETKQGNQVSSGAIHAGRREPLAVIRSGGNGNQGAAQKARVATASPSGPLESSSSAWFAPKEISRGLNIPLHSISGRISELKQAGRIYKTRERREDAAVLMVGGE